MGRRTVPMEPMPPDATPEERLRILQNYREYLGSGVAQSERMMGYGLAVVILLTIFGSFILLSALALR